MEEEKLENRIEEVEEIEKYFIFDDEIFFGEDEI